MKILWNNGWFAVPVLTFFCLGLWIKYQIPYGYEILWFNGWREEPYNTLFRAATVLGEYPAFLLAIAVVALWRPRVAILIALMGALMSPFQYFIKDQFAVDRPITYLQAVGMRDYVVLVPRVQVHTGQTSFPSGHTTAAFALYTVLTLCLPSRYRVVGLGLALCAILTGVSRIFLVQHFLADVLAGGALGILIALGFWEIAHATRFLTPAPAEASEEVAAETVA